jgi:hypothetical protein
MIYEQYTKPFSITLSLKKVDRENKLLLSLNWIYPIFNRNTWLNKRIFIIFVVFS